MTTVHFARHGETVWHERNRYAGSSDIGLTPHGLRQAEQLARWAAGAGLSGVVSSTASRAVSTAEPSARAAGTALRTDPRLVEVAFGRGEGLTSAEMWELFPSERRAFEIAPASNALPGGESGRDALSRAIPSIEALRDAEPEGAVLLVAHSTLVRLLICWAVGIPLDQYRSALPRLDNVALTTLSLPRSGTLESRCALLRLNVPV